MFCEKRLNVRCKTKVAKYLDSTKQNKLEIVYEIFPIEQILSQKLQFLIENTKKTYHSKLDIELSKKCSIERHSTKDRLYEEYLTFNDTQLDIVYLL